MTPGHKENSGVAARIAAAQVLDAVLSRHKILDDVLDQILTKARLPDIDQRLVHAITVTVFRHLPQIDATLRRAMTQKRDPKPSIVHNLLRIGAAQLLYMEIPDHAALDATVSACGSLKLIRQKSFINACLRSVQRGRDSAPPAPASALERLPEWLAGTLIEQYGQVKAENIAAGSLLHAPIDITLNDLKAPIDMTQMPQGDLTAPWSVRVSDSPGHITSWPGFKGGAWWVQDLAASLPINMLGDIHDKSVLDIGAAPGGKTLQLAAKGAHVTALDVSGSRMERLHQNLTRVPVRHKVQTVIADACKWTPIQMYDVVVLDAPCSSTGTLRRHPELPWIRSQKEVSDLGVIQRDLLGSAAKMLRASGRLLYCTCSLLPQEGESQVEAFLAAHKDFKEVRDIPAMLSPFLSPGVGGIGFRTFPDTLAAKGGMDGFFMALLQKQ